MLEKLIAYEAVHEIHGWDDLRRRLAPDRRCFAFFHPALPGEPLIFVEVALLEGLAAAVPPLLLQDFDDVCGVGAGRTRRHRDLLLHLQLPGRAARHLLRQLPDQAGGRGAPQRISAAQLLFHPVTGARLPALAHAVTPRTTTISRRCYGRPTDRRGGRIRHGTRNCAPACCGSCAQYLTQSAAAGRRIDPVARFHLGNGARLERINWLGNTAPRAIQESFGIMVNYLYDHDSIEDNHEAFARDGRIVRAPAVDMLLRDDS